MFLHFTTFWQTLQWPLFVGWCMVVLINSELYCFGTYSLGPKYYLLNLQWDPTATFFNTWVGQLYDVQGGIWTWQRLVLLRHLVAGRTNATLGSSYINQISPELILVHVIQHYIEIDRLTPYIPRPHQNPTCMRPTPPCPDFVIGFSDQQWAVLPRTYSLGP